MLACQRYVTVTVCGWSAKYKQLFTCSLELNASPRLCSTTIRMGKTAILMQAMTGPSCQRKNIMISWLPWRKLCPNYLPRRKARHEKKVCLCAVCFTHCHIVTRLECCCPF